MTQIDDVAQAICATTVAGRVFPWDGLNEGERDLWREMAKAAIGAIGLTEQWGHSIQGQNPCVNHSRDEAQEALVYWSRKFPDVDHNGQLWHRFSTEWMPA